MGVFSKVKKSLKSVAKRTTKPLTVAFGKKKLNPLAKIAGLAKTVAKEGGAAAVAPGLAGMMQRRGSNTALGRLALRGKGVSTPQERMAQGQSGGIAPTAASIPAAVDSTNIRPGVQASDVAPAAGVISPEVDAAAAGERKRKRMGAALGGAPRTILG